MKKILILLLFTGKSFGQIQTVGISAFNFMSSSQYMDEWCWAASIQMVYNYYHINISQYDIVARTYGLDSNGNLINRSVTNTQISNALVGGNDLNGRFFSVNSAYYSGVPIPSELIKELYLQHPVILSYSTGVNTGHVVVLTSCEYYMSNSGPVITRLITCDPWPSAVNISNNGFVAFSDINKILGFWIVRVY